MSTLDIYSTLYNYSQHLADWINFFDNLLGICILPIVFVSTYALIEKNHIKIVQKVM